MTGAVRGGRVSDVPLAVFRASKAVPTGQVRAGFPLAVDQQPDAVAARAV
jgi:hypothetical protein